jgi:hypothetical protein
MRKLMVLMVGAMLFAGGGCKNDNNDSSMDHKGAMSNRDDCPHCPGVQHARADGTCPMCGAKVK